MNYQPFPSFVIFGTNSDFQNLEHIWVGKMSFPKFLKWPPLPPSTSSKYEIRCWSCERMQRSVRRDSYAVSWLCFGLICRFILIHFVILLCRLIPVFWIVMQICVLCFVIHFVLWIDMQIYSDTFLIHSDTLWYILCRFILIHFHRGLFMGYLDMEEQIANYCNSCFMWIRR